MEAQARTRSNDRQNAVGSQKPMIARSGWRGPLLLLLLLMVTSDQKHTTDVPTKALDPAAERYKHSG